MDRTIQAGPRTGTATAPASKSLAHRLLIAAALSEKPVSIRIGAASQDVEATVRCLSAAGARIERSGDTVTVIPVPFGTGETGGALCPEGTVFPCGESASTMRFLLPVLGAFGIRGFFRMEGRLPGRPITPLADALEAHGMRIGRDGERLSFGGKLAPGEYAIRGDISSQFISGLLFALPLLSGDTILRVTGTAVSRGYIEMTENVLRLAGIRFAKNGRSYTVPGGQRYRLPDGIEAERDWSCAAAFLAAGAFSERGVTVRGLEPASFQGDRGILDVLSQFGASVRTSAAGVTVKKRMRKGTTVDAADIPDLVPVIAAVAAASEGKTRIVNAGRLRLKESDRLRATTEMLRTLGADIRETEDGLIIHGKRELTGGTVDPAHDHRIAMAAAVAASAATDPVTVRDSDCTDKSFPGFWEEFGRLEEER